MQPPTIRLGFSALQLFGLLLTLTPIIGAPNPATATISPIVNASQVLLFPSLAPPIPIPWTLIGSADVTATDITNLTAGIFSAGNLTIPVTDPAAFPITGLFVSSATNGTGNFTAVDVAGGGGPMPLIGSMNVCLFAPCLAPAANVIVPFTSGDFSGVGLGGTPVTAASYINVTMTGNAWTTGTASVGSFSVSGSPLQTCGFSHECITLVTPTMISTNVAALPLIPAFSIMTLEFLADVVINNGLAPPNPANVIGAENSLPGKNLTVRALGCGTPPIECHPSIQTVVAIKSGGFVGGNLKLGPGAENFEKTGVQIRGGAVLGSAYIGSGGQITMDGGSIAGGVGGEIATSFTLNAGTVGGAVVGDHGSGGITISGGSVRSIHSSGNILLTGGSIIGNLVHIGAFSTLDWHGGTVGGKLVNSDAYRTIIYGTNFALNGVPIGYGAIPDLTGTLTGTLENGDPLNNIFMRTSFDYKDSRLILAPPSGVPGLILTPLRSLNEPGQHHTLVATVTNDLGVALNGVPVTFSVVSGPNAGSTGSCTTSAGHPVGDCMTDASGMVAFTYTGTGGSGVDHITASRTDVTGTVRTATALKFWDEDCNQNHVPDTCDISCGGFGGQCAAFDGGGGVAACGQSMDANHDQIPGECNAPPDCTNAGAEPKELWPPNNKFRNVSVAGVTDVDGNPIAITITAIHQDEPVGLAATGEGIGSSSARVLAQRDGDVDGRVYHVGFMANDGRGGLCSGQVIVCVPHDMRPGHQCIDGGALYDSTPIGSGQPRCGVGFELAFVLPPLLWLRGRRSRPTA